MSANPHANEQRVDGINPAEVQPRPTVHSGGQNGVQQVRVIDVQTIDRDRHDKPERYLLEKNMSPDPMRQFDVWFKNVVALSTDDHQEPQAVCLTTAEDDRPTSRMVLMKKYDADGFSFFTNYTSRKERHLTANPNAALLFYWCVVDRQIRIEGTVERLPGEVADAYWKARPLASRISAKVSQQSAVIPSRECLDEKRKEWEKLAGEQGEEVVTRPETWGGYLLRPTYFEFYEVQRNWVHDRIVYEKAEDGIWTMTRLAA